MSTSLPTPLVDAEIDLDAQKREFEDWSKREGALNLEPARFDEDEIGRLNATYHYAPTETAWRAWMRSAYRAAARLARSTTTTNGSETLPIVGIDGMETLTTFSSEHGTLVRLSDSKRIVDHWKQVAAKSDAVGVLRVTLNTESA